MAKDKKQPPLISVNLTNVFKIRKMIMSRLEFYLGQVIDSETMSYMVDSVLEVLPKGIEKRTLREALWHLTGTKPVEEDIQKTAWRLAGNIRRLRASSPVTPWREQIFPEWSPAQIVDCRIGRTKKGKAGATFTFRILAGTATSELAKKFWTIRFCRYMAGEKKIGFTPPWGAFPLKKLEQLVGFRLYLLLERPPKGFDHGRSPWFDTVRATGAMSLYNRALTKRRARVGFKCPMSFKHPCHNCWVGYDRCAVAVHPRTFVRELCVECSREHWMDPEMLPLGICVECQRRHDMSN